MTCALESYLISERERSAPEHFRNTAEYERTKGTRDAASFRDSPIKNRADGIASQRGKTN